MILIIGGAAQGKTAYAKVNYPDRCWIDGRECVLEDVYSCGGILHFHEYLRRLMEVGGDVRTFGKELLQNNPDIVIVTNEIGYGVVPMDRFLRDYREQTGRVCTELAGYASKVIRIVCGIPMVLKGEN